MQSDASPSLMQLALLALLWGLYGAVHSVLASLRVKAWVGRHWPGALPGYRLAFNALAVLLFLPPLLLMRTLHGPLLWQWTGLARWLADGLALAAVLGFFATLRGYDLAAFAGTAAWRARAAKAKAPVEALHLGWLHRQVRHPWYFLALVMIWTRPMDAAYLLSALCWTAYLAIGLRFEERKLLRDYGEAYRRYQRQVPALLPRPWRRISAVEAQALEALAQREQLAAGMGHTVTAAAPPAQQ